MWPLVGKALVATKKRTLFAASLNARNIVSEYRVCVQELQEALKSFLDLACHCDIYDLFDDALFDTIALDPSGWLEEFVNDKDVKIIIISSIGEATFFGPC